MITSQFGNSLTSICWTFNLNSCPSSIQFSEFKMSMTRSSSLRFDIDSSPILTSSLKPCYYIHWWEPPQCQFHGYHLSLFTMRCRCRISFPYLKCNVLHVKKVAGHCFLWKTDRQPQWTGASGCKSLMGKEVHRDEILRAFRHPHAPPQCALDSWPRLRVLKEHNIIK